MLHGDSDDRLLAAIRGQRVGAEDPAEAAELRAAQRIGGIARSIETEVPVDPSSLFEETPAVGLGSFSDIAEALGDELEGTETSNVISMRRRFPARAWMPSAAAAGIALLAGAFFFLGGADDDSFAGITLDPVREGRATAELRGSGEDLRLHVDVEGLAAEDGYLELWLIDADVTQLISLGPLQEDGVYRLPAGLDPADFPVVDVSVEPFDGDPTHSGQTVFRGQFEL